MPRVRLAPLWLGGHIVGFSSFFVWTLYTESDLLKSDNLLLAPPTRKKVVQVLPPPKPSPRLNIDATVFERPSLVRRLSISDELPPGALEYFSLDRVADRVDERPDSDISSLGWMPDAPS